jgi:HSP20 family protein
MKLIKRTNNWLPAAPSFFDDFVGRDLSSWFDHNYSYNGDSVPAVNVRETGDNFELELAVPGMTKKDFKVEFEKDILTISSEKKENKEDGNRDGNYYRREFSYQGFMRSFSLPENTVDADKIRATYQDGVLKVEIPKKEEVKPKPARLIEIS